MNSGGPVNPVSARRSAEQEDYDQLRHRLLPGPCQVCGPLRAAAAELGRPIPLLCAGTAFELHHRRKRSSAGALTNPANVLRSCNTGNLAIEDHPVAAKKAGLVVRPGHPEWEALSARAWRLAQLDQPPPADPPPRPQRDRHPCEPDPF